MQLRRPESRSQSVYQKRKWLSIQANQQLCSDAQTYPEPRAQGYLLPFPEAAFFAIEDILE